MRLEVKQDWTAINGVNGLQAIIPKGIHEVERIPNPRGHEAPWLVLKGTMIGQSELSWRQWKNGVLATNSEHPDFGTPIDWKESEVVIYEDDIPVFGYVILNGTGTTLDRNLFWGSNKVPQKGYVHTEESLQVIRVTSRAWDVKPVLIYPATFFNGQVVVKAPQSFSFA